ncbi:MAG TPA: hypothetical protein VGE74_10540 [Gemmata sp.]
MVEILKPLVTGPRVVLARDDTPTARYGPKVQGTEVHHNLCLWAVTMTEVWAWNQKAEDLVGHRSASPWDDPNQRPSHADKRRAWQHQLLAQEIQAVVGENHDLAYRCLDLSA